MIKLTLLFLSVNVNNRDYKIMMETEAFKEENNGTAPSLGDLAPKRQWRSPKHALSYFSQQIQKKYVYLNTIEHAF